MKVFLPEDRKDYKVQMFKNTVKKIPFARPVWRKLVKTWYSLFRKTNVAVFHTARCGSTVVGNMLDTHADIYWASELFDKLYEKYPDQIDKPNFARTVITNSMYSRRVKIYGFETKYLPHQHLGKGKIGMGVEEYFRFLCSLNFSKFIVFQRKNYLRQIVSLMVARINKEWHAKDKKTDVTKITIDVHSTQISGRTEPLLDQLRYIEENSERLKMLLPGNETLYLCYEDDILEDPRKGYHKICRFLGIQSESPPISRKRTNPFPLKDMITNFDEVRSLLKNTKYHWMLDS